MSRALIIEGGWDGHRPEELANRFERALAATDRYEVTVAKDLDCLDEPEKLAEYALIVPNWTAGELSREREKNLCQAVYRGVGLAGVHGAAGDAFRGALDYEWMVGGHFVGHPYVGPYTVTVAAPDHPLTRDLPECFVYESEQYYMMVDPGINVLLETEYDLGAGFVTMPVAWTKRWGAGRVFYSALGHVPDEFDAYPEVWRFTVRGLLWASL